MSKEKETTENNKILVEAGKFEMGDKRYYVKLITITKDFYICKHPVTFAEYDEFCENVGKEKPDDTFGLGRDDRPIINVSWYDAIEYCNWRSRKEDGLEEVYTINKSEKDINNHNEDRWDNLKWTVTCDFDKNGYRLPTEAEWEFAARGGNKSKGFEYSGSNEVNEVAWNRDNSDDRTHPVGDKLQNELGIHDMSGNVWEWCWDWRNLDDQDYYDPKGSKASSQRVFRGGSWRKHTDFCTVGGGLSYNPSDSDYDIGFRVSRTC